MEREERIMMRSSKWIGVRRTGLVGVLSVGLFGSHLALAGGLPLSLGELEAPEPAWSHARQDPGTAEWVAKGTLDAAAIEAIELEFEKARLDFLLKREVGNYDARLIGLAKRLSTSQPAEAQWTLLVALARERGQSLLDAGRHEDAKLALARLLQPRRETGATGSSKSGWVVLDTKLRDQELQRLADAQVTALLKAIEESQSTGGGGPLEARVDLDDPYVQTILELIKQKEFSRLRTLGTTALPILEQVALEGRNEFPDHRNEDLLSYISELSSLRGARVALRGLELGGDIWRLRVVRLLDGIGVPGMTTSRGSRGEIAKQWGAVVERLIAHPSNYVAVLPRALNLMAEGYDTPTLRAALTSGLQSSQPEVRQAVLGPLSAMQGNLSVFVPFFEEVMATGSLETRLVVGEWLVERCAPTGDLSPYVEDPDVRIRTLVARALHKSIQARDGRFLEEEAQRILKLADDESEKVRLWVAATLVMLEDADSVLPAFEQLAVDSDVKVRAYLASLGHANSESSALDEVYTILASDKDPGVVKEVDMWITRKLAGNDVYKDRTRFIPVVAARLKSADGQFLEIPKEIRDRIYRSMMVSKGGVSREEQVRASQQWAELALETEEPHLMRLLCYYSNSSKSEGPPMLDIPVNGLEALLLRATREEGGVTSAGSLFEHMGGERYADRPEWIPMLRRVAQSTQTDVRTRSYALNQLLIRELDGASAMLAPILRSAMWKDLRFTSSFRSFLQELGDHLGVETDQVATQLLQDPAVAVVPLGLILKGAYEMRSMPRAVADAALRVHFDGKPAERGSAEPIVEMALASLVDQTTEADWTRLQRAFYMPAFTKSLVDHFSRSPHPRWLPLLADALQAPWIEYHNVRLNVSMAAARAVTNYYSDEAAMILLEGMRHATINEVREQCMIGLESIRLFRDEEEQLERRRSAHFERDTAIQDLSKLLLDEDPGIQAEAARALATLDAVDALPQLIRLLKTEDEGLRAAVKAAIDRLNRSADSSTKGD